MTSSHTQHVTCGDGCSECFIESVHLLQGQRCKLRMLCDDWQSHTPYNVQPLATMSVALVSVILFIFGELRRLEHSQSHAPPCHMHHRVTTCGVGGCGCCREMSYCIFAFFWVWCKHTILDHDMQCELRWVPAVELIIFMVQIIDALARATRLGWPILYYYDRYWL